MWLTRHLPAKPTHLTVQFLNITIRDCHATWKAKVNYILLYKIRPHTLFDFSSIYKYLLSSKNTYYTELIFIIQYYIYLVLVTSRGASLAPSHAASRTASPVFSAGAVSNSEDTSLPVVLCNLLQKEFSPRRSSFDDRSSRKGGGKGRRAGEEQEEEPGKQKNKTTNQK